MSSPRPQRTPRSNEEWLNALRGDSGGHAQNQAIEELANFLYIVVYNYLYRHQTNIPLIQDWSTVEVAELAQDCAQDTMIKIAANDFALLNQFQGIGKFTSWTAVIARHVTISVLRLARFSHQQIDLEKASSIQTDDVDPQTQVNQQEVMNALQECVERLADNRQIALIECIFKGRRAKDVAMDMGKNENAVNLQVMHAKRQVRACMDGKGLGIDTLGFFD